MSNNPSTDRTDHADHTFRHSLKLPNPLGLHARPATQLSKMVKKLDARVFIESESGQRADCRKMFELLGLGLSHGAAITVISDDEAVLRFFAESNDLPTAERVQRFLSREDFFGQDLTQVPDLADAVIDALEAIQTQGIRAVMQARFGV